MIPKHCIKIFKSKFGYHPSIIAVDSEYIKIDINKFFSKSLVIWTYHAINDLGEKIDLEKFMEYDSHGIMIYINRDGNIFILTTQERMNVAEFMISNLKRK